MRKHIILFFLALLFFACNRVKTPDGIIKEDVMIPLLVDIHIIDGSLANESTVDSLYKYGTGRYIYIFKKYHTDPAKFKKSIKYYTLQTDNMIKMYSEVARILQAKADSLTQLQEKEVEKDKLLREKLAKQEAKKAKEKAKQDSIKLKKDSVKNAGKTKPVKKKSKQNTTTTKNALPQ
jgi:hypothetical protein